MFRLTGDLSPDIVMMLLFSLPWVHREGCWHSWHKLNFSAEHIKPSGPLRRPLLGVFDIFRHGFTQPKESQRSCAISRSRVLLSWSKPRLSLDQRKPPRGQTEPELDRNQDAERVWRSCLFRPIFRSALGLLGVAFQTHPPFHRRSTPFYRSPPPPILTVTQSPHMVCDIIQIKTTEAHCH